MTPKFKVGDLVQYHCPEFKQINGLGIIEETQEFDDRFKSFVVKVKWFSGNIKDEYNAFAGTVGECVLKKATKQL